MPKLKRWLDFLHKIRILIILGSFLIINTAIWSDLIIKRKAVIEFGPYQIVLLAVGILLFILGLYLQFPRLVRTVSKVLSILLFVAGFILTSINLAGIFIPLRDPEINTKEYQPYGLNKRIQYDQDEVFEAFDRRQNETNEAYAYRLVNLVFDNTLHFFEPENPEKYNQRVPIFENFIIFATSLIPSRPDIYVFCNPYKAMERGVGLCNQFSKIVYAILEENGIRARILVLTGHVVVEALIDDNPHLWWILDADLGVVIEHDLETLENNLELVEQAYLERGYSADQSARIAEIYGADGNYVQTNRGYCQSERQRYINKWLWPVGAMLPWGLSKLIGRLFPLNHKRNP